MGHVGLSFHQKPPQWVGPPGGAKYPNCKEVVTDDHAFASWAVSEIFWNLVSMSFTVAGWLLCLFLVVVLLVQ